MAASASAAAPTPTSPFDITFGAASALTTLVTSPINALSDATGSVARSLSFRTSAQVKKEEEEQAAAAATALQAAHRGKTARAELKKSKTMSLQNSNMMSSIGPLLLLAIVALVVAFFMQLGEGVEPEPPIAKHKWKILGLKL
jgi:Flp pilus assembly protein TadB